MTVLIEHVERGRGVHSLLDAVPVSNVGIKLNQSAGERGGHNLLGLQDIQTDHGPSQGQNLAVTGLAGPSSRDSGMHGGGVQPLLEAFPVPRRAT